MQVHKVVIPTEPGSTHYWFLCSDLHIGSVNFDLKRWRQDMDAARRVNARILVNGDVFDAIDFKDKRFDANVLLPELRGEKDLQGAVVGLATSYFEPYADLIHVIGIGNHEEKWIFHNANDPVARLIERLNAGLEQKGTDHRIRHGGIGGYIRTVFRFPKYGDQKTPSVSHDLLYFHGSGGDSPVTRGTIDFYRKENQFVFDAVTQGHKHHKTFIDGVTIELSRNGHIRPRERKLIQTGSYFQNYKRTSQDNPLDYSYAESKHHAPKPIGGMFLRLKPVREKIDDMTFNCVYQDVMTSP